MDPAQQKALLALFRPAPGSVPQLGRLCPGGLFAPGLLPLGGASACRCGGAVLAPNPSDPDDAVLSWADRLLAEGVTLALLLDAPSLTLLKVLGRRGFLPRAGQPLQAARLLLVQTLGPPFSPRPLKAPSRVLSSRPCYLSARAMRCFLWRKSEGTAPGLSTVPGASSRRGSLSEPARFGRRRRSWGFGVKRQRFAPNFALRIGMDHASTALPTAARPFRACPERAPRASLCGCLGMPCPTGACGPMTEAGCPGCSGVTAFEPASRPPGRGFLPGTSPLTQHRSRACLLRWRGRGPGH